MRQQCLGDVIWNHVPVLRKYRHEFDDDDDVLRCWLCRSLLSSSLSAGSGSCCFRVVNVLFYLSSQHRRLPRGAVSLTVVLLLLLKGKRKTWGCLLVLMI